MWLGREQFLGGEARVGGQVDPEAAQRLLIPGGWQVRDVHFAAAQLGELLHGQPGGGVGGGADTQGDERFR